MIIDFHAHYMPSGYLSEADRFDNRPSKERYLRHDQLLDLEVRFRLMEKLGISTQIIGSRGWVDPLDGAAEIRASRASNDEIAKIAEEHESRLIGLASLPLNDVGLSLDEMSRAIIELGLKGIWLPSNVNGKPLDSPELIPIYERSLQLQVPVFIHPVEPRTLGEHALNMLKPYGIKVSLGFVFESSFSVLRLILSGVLEKYPNLNIVLPHLGGVLPYLTGRIDHQSSVYRSEINRPPSEYLGKIFVDTVSGFAPAISCALSMPGPDKILFGTDYPYLDPGATLATLRKVNLNPEDTEKILYKNAKKILRL